LDFQLKEFYSLDQNGNRTEKTFPDKNEYFIPFHIDEFALQNPVKGAIFNMINFDCDTESASTLLLDSTKIFDSLLDSEVEILNNVRYHYLIKDSSNNEVVSDSFCPIQNHVLSNKNMVYINPTRQFYIDECPEESHLCDKILRSILTKIFNAKNDCLIHRWQENDILFVDMSRMFHAVLGGFDSEKSSMQYAWIK